MKKIASLLSLVLIIFLFTTLGACKKKPVVNVDLLLTQINVIYGQGETNNTVQSNISLPTKIDSYDVVWTSSHPTVISPTGVVTRGDNDQNVILTASITANNITKTKDFPFIVKKNNMVQTNFKLVIPATISTNISNLNNIPSDTEIIITITPPIDKKLKKLLLNDQDVTTNIINNQLKFKINQDIIVHVEYDDIIFYQLILPTMVSANITNLTKIATDQEIKLTINEPVGQYLTSFLVNGEEKVSEVQNNKFTFKITSNTKVDVTFAPKCYRVIYDNKILNLLTTGINENSVAHDTTLSFTVILPIGRVIDNILVNDNPAILDSENKLNVTINSETTIIVNLKTRQYNVTFNPNGAVSEDNATELFFSEYYEDLGQNKALEIYNPTAHDIDLGEYQIGVYPNGATSPRAKHTINYLIGPKQAIVLIHEATTDPVLKAIANVSHKEALGFNGNDAIGLFKGNTLIDVIGTIGETADFGKDCGFIRKPTAFVASSTFDLNMWEKVTLDAHTLGSHTINNLLVIPNQTIPHHGLVIRPNITITKPGYQFVDWYDEDNRPYDFSKEVTSDLVLTAVYKKIHTVTLNLYDGVISGETKFLVIDGEKVMCPLNNPTKEHYTFVNWYTDDTFSIVFDFTQAITSDLIIHAHYTVINYKVAFYDNGNLLAEKEVAYNTTVEAIVAPFKVGHHFTNWYTTNTLTTIFDFTKPIMGPTKIYAGFAPNDYNVTFYDGTAELVALALVIKYNQTIPTLPTAVKDGYTFINWYLEETLENIFVATTIITDNLKLYAKFTPNKYLLTYSSSGLKVESNTEIIPNNTEVFYDTILKITLTYNNTTHKFKAFKVNDNFYPLSETTPNSSFNLTVKGITKLALLLVKIDEWTVSFNTFGGSAVAEQVIPNGGHATRPSDPPTKEGHTFIDWYQEESFEHIFDFATSIIMADTIIYAKFEIISYEVTFYDNTLLLTTLTQTIPYRGKVTNIIAPAKEGYHFINWYEEATLTTVYDFSQEVISSFRLYAKYEINTYLVKFFDGTNELATLNKMIKHNECYGVAIAPSKTGYDFIGFYHDELFSTAIDLTTHQVIAPLNIYLKYQRQVFMVRFISEGSEIVSLRQTISYGEKVSKPAESDNPTKVGHTFEGWYYDELKFDFGDYIITKNIDIIAKFEPLQLHVDLDPAGGELGIYAQDLIISEFVNGRENNQAFELFNATNQVINLANYEIKIYNRSHVLLKTIALNGTLAHLRSYVIANKDATYTQIKDKTDLAIDYVDLAEWTIIELLKEGVVIDTLGDSSDDWDEFKKDCVCIRHENVLKPNMTFELYAEYEYYYDEFPNSIDLGYHTMQIVEGQTALYSIAIAYGKKLPTINAQRAGYKFSGWFTQSGDPFDVTQVITASIKVVAHWELIYKITFDLDGGNLAGLALEQLINPGSLVTNPGTPTKDGYLFLKWIDTSNNMPFDFSIAPSAHTTIKATYEFLLTDINAATLDNIITCLKDAKLGLDTTLITNENENYLKEALLSLRPADGFTTLTALKETYALALANYARAKAVDDKVAALLANLALAKGANDHSQIDLTLWTALVTLINEVIPFINKTVNGLLLTQINPHAVYTAYQALALDKQIAAKEHMLTLSLTTMEKVISALYEGIANTKDDATKVAEELALINIPTIIEGGTTTIAVPLSGQIYNAVSLNYEGNNSAVKLEGTNLIFTPAATDISVIVTVRATLNATVQTKEFNITIRGVAEERSSTITRKKKNTNGIRNGSIKEHLNFSNDGNIIETLFEKNSGDNKIFNNASGLRLYPTNQLTLKVTGKKIKTIKVNNTANGAKCKINGKEYTLKKETKEIIFDSPVDEVVIIGVNSGKQKVTFSEIIITYV